MKLTLIFILIICVGYVKPDKEKCSRLKNNVQLSGSKSDYIKIKGSNYVLRDNHDQCMTLCQNTDDCHYWYTTKNAKYQLRCYLMRRYTESRRETGVISGSRYICKGECWDGRGVCKASHTECSGTFASLFMSRHLGCDPADKPICCTKPVAIGGICRTDIQCSTANTVCSGGKCQCRSGYYCPSDSWFFIQALNGLVMDIPGASEGKQMILYKKHGGNNQLWKWDSDGRLVSKSKGLVLDIAGDNDKEGASVIARKQKGANNQKWELRGEYIHSKFNDMVMQATGSEQGAKIQLGSKTSSKEQKWTMVAETTEGE